MATDAHSPARFSHNHTAAKRWWTVFQSETATVTGIALLSVIFAWSLWNKLTTLLYCDMGRWLSAVERFAQGQTYYRDYAWQYGPLSAFAFGYPMRWFGATFAVAQGVIIVFSVILIALTYLLVRRLFPPSLRLPVMTLFLCVCATSQTYFSVFSLQIYSPASQPAVIGCLLLLLGAFRYLERGKGRSLGLAVLVLGAWVSLLSKQESMTVVPFFLPLVVLFDRSGTSEAKAWLRQSLLLFVLCLLPPVLVYALCGMTSGLPMVIGNLNSFGLASGICPWWPTGLGLLGVLAALGAGTFLMSAGTLAELSRWRKYCGGRLYLLWALAALGLVPYALYEWEDLATVLTGSAGARFTAVKSLLSTTTLFLPALWFGIGILLRLTLRFFQNRGKLPLPDAAMVLLLTVATLVSVRGFFSNAMGPRPELPAVAHPIMMIVGCYLLLRWLERPYGEAGPRMLLGAHAVPAALLIFLTLGYAAIRVVGAYPGLLSDKAYTKIETEAGPIRLSEAASREIYQYLIANTNPSDSVLELPMTGGMSFATKRINPVYNSLFWEIRPQPEIQSLDMAGIERHPPAVVVGKNRPALGTFYGYPYRIACPCPRLVWQADGLAGDADITLRVAAYVEQNYAVDKEIGEWVLLRPRRPLTPSGLTESLSRGD